MKTIWRPSQCRLERGEIRKVRTKACATCAVNQTKLGTDATTNRKRPTKPSPIQMRRIIQVLAALP